MCAFTCVTGQNRKSTVSFSIKCAMQGKGTATYAHMMAKARHAVRCLCGWSRGPRAPSLEISNLTGRCGARHAR